MDHNNVTNNNQPVGVTTLRIANTTIEIRADFYYRNRKIIDRCVLDINQQWEHFVRQGEKNDTALAKIALQFARYSYAARSLEEETNKVLSAFEKDLDDIVLKIQ